jgi:hypothetical protein
MKKQLSISISQQSYDLLLKNRRNVSAYIEDLLRTQYVEENKVAIAKTVLNQIKQDSDLKYFLKVIVNEYMEERRKGDWHK